MQLTSIRYVIAVAKLGSFTKAAEELYVSQPALSQAIRRLEQELKAELFTREKNKVFLTPAGEVLMEEGQRMLEAEQSIRKRLQELEELDTGKLTIGGAPSYLRYYSMVLTEFQAQHPRAQLILRDGFTQNLCADLLAGTLDIGLLAEPVPAGIDHFPIFQEEIFLALPLDHPLNSSFPQEGDPYPVADLRLCRDEKFICYQPGRRITGILLAETQRAGFTPNIVRESSSTENANAMIRHGLGIGFVPEVTVRLCPKEQHARYYRLRPEGLTRFFYIGRKAGKFNSRLQEKFFQTAKPLQIVRKSQDR